MESQKFPKGFYFGAATSAHQVEGNNHNDWTEWEKSPERIADLKKRGLNPEGFISGRACDHYNRFREDFDIAKKLGHNAHRFPIEWSRVEPEEGKFDEKEIEHYHEVIKALRDRGIEPFVTLWHWTLPLWVRDQGAWENKKTAADFVRFCEKMAVEFKDEVRYWMILNEPEYWIGHTYALGIFPSGKKNILKIPLLYLRLARAHRFVYRKLKKINSDFQIGVVESTGWIEPFAARLFLSYVRNFLFPWLVKGYFDFFGLNYYRVNDLLYFLHHGKREKSEIGWEIYPEGICRLAKKAHRYFKKPIIITENGIADSTDTKRAQFIRAHLVEVERAISESVDIRGYFYWSLLDNFEWDSGFGPRFGLVEINYKTLERKPRQSAWEYAKIIAPQKYKEVN